MRGDGAEANLGTVVCLINRLGEDFGQCRSKSNFQFQHTKRGVRYLLSWTNFFLKIFEFPYVVSVFLRDRLPCFCRLVLLCNKMT